MSFMGCVLAAEQDGASETQHSLASADLSCLLCPKTLLGLTSNILWDVHCFKAQVVLTCPGPGQGSCIEGLKRKSRL